MKTRRGVLGDMVRLGVAAALTPRAALAQSGQADLILFNGKVVPVDAQNTISEAVAIQGGKVLKVGSNQEIQHLGGPLCRKIDLQGKMVTPGLIDSHYHLMYYGQQFWPGYLNIRIPEAQCKADVLRLVGEKAKQLAAGQWISGNQGYHLRFGETLDRWDLDQVAPNNPVYLRQGSGQCAAVNSLALQIAGIDASTPNPTSSLILHDSQGEPTGILSHYPAEQLVAQHATGYGDRTEEQKLEDIDIAQDLCLQAGYTSVQDVIVGSWEDIEVYRKYANSGKLKVRLYLMLYINTQEQADKIVSKFQPIDSGRLKFGGWKLALDGGCAVQTTLMYDKSLYAAGLSYPYHSQEALNRLARTLHDTGLQVAVHVLGDQGIDMTLTAFEEAMKASPRPDPRHRIEHGLFPTPEALPRMKAGGIVLSTQPHWIPWFGDSFLQTTNEQTMAHFLPLKTMLQMGVPLAFGCDVPSALFQEPKWAFSGAGLRRCENGTVLTPEERLSGPEMVRIHTMGSAYAGFSETTTGSLEPGKCADLTIWSHDLFNLKANELNSLRAEMTIIDGEIVYDAGTLA